MKGCSKHKLILANLLRGEFNLRGKIVNVAVPSDASTFINSNDCCIGNLQGSKFAIGEAVSLPISP